MRKGILLVGYGASNPESREGLRSFETLCRDRFKNLPVRWAFTSPLVRQRMADHRQKGDSVNKALKRLAYERFRSVAIQPLQTIAGSEYENLKNISNMIAQETGLNCSLGKPLLSTSADIPQIARALYLHIPSDTGSDDIIFVAHGARHPAGIMYSLLNQHFKTTATRVHICSLSGAPYLEDLLDSLKSKTVWIMPLLSIIGVHALRDMTGNIETSCKQRIEAAGFHCVPILRGMTQSYEISQIWLNNLAYALKELD